MTDEPDTRPAPMSPPDCDLQDFRWMKLDIVSLFNSDFNFTANDTAWRAGVTLWARAWHQVPAGSLPAEDIKLCNLAGLGRDLATWADIKAEALHGFVLCSDGRLYHKFLCAKAVEAHEERLEFSAKKAVDRERKKAKRTAADKGKADGSSPENGVASDGTPQDIRNISSGIPSDIQRPSDGIPADIQVTSDGAPPEFRRNLLLEGEGEGEGEKKEKKQPRASAGAGARESLFASVKNMTTCAETGKQICNGWYVDVIMRKVFDAAGIDDARWTGRADSLITWLADGIDPDTITAAIRGCAARSRYVVPSSLSWFDKPVRAAHEALSQPGTRGVRCELGRPRLVSTM